MSRLEHESKFLALILRHKPETINIRLDDHGWADVSELLTNWPDNMKITMEDLEFIVDTDNKQRYSFNDNKTLIRANQGHSVPVDVELEEKEPPAVLYHGTATRFENSIDKEGLKPQTRLYVHLSRDIDTAKNVGSRHGKPVIYVVDSGKMYKDGYKFYLSTNNVWLTKEVPPTYLTKE